MSDQMLCMFCNQHKGRDAFPNRAFAQCWECAWESHIRDSHPEIVRRIKREAKKRAKRLSDRAVEDAMFAHERRIVLGHREPRKPLLPCQDCYLPTVATCDHGHYCPECRDAGCQLCADEADPLDAAETARDDAAIDARREGL